MVRLVFRIVLKYYNVVTIFKSLVAYQSRWWLHGPEEKKIGHVKERKKILRGEKKTLIITMQFDQFLYFYYIFSSYIYDIFLKNM